MAKRKKKKKSFRGFGAVAKHGAEYRGRARVKHTMHVGVTFTRDIGASTARQYQADACVVAKGKMRAAGYNRRCGFGTGRTPTAASKKALRSLAQHLK